MQPDTEQEKAIREKIHNRSAENDKPELRPIEKTPMQDDIKKAREQGYVSSTKTNWSGILVMAIILIIVIAITVWLL